MKIILNIFLLATSVVSQQVVAQSLVQSVVALEPQQFMHEGELLACGIKIAAIEPPPGNSMVISQVIMNTDVVSKIIFQADTIRYGKQPTFESQGPIESAWIRFGDGNAIELVDARSLEHNRLLADVKTASVMPQIIQLAERETKVQVGIKLKNSGSERISSGAATFALKDRVAFRDCVRELFSKAILR